MAPNEDTVPCAEAGFTDLVLAAADGGFARAPALFIALVPEAVGGSTIGSLDEQSGDGGGAALQPPRLVAVAAEAVGLLPPADVVAPGAPKFAFTPFPRPARVVLAPPLMLPSPAQPADVAAAVLSRRVLCCAATTAFVRPWLLALVAVVLSSRWAPWLTAESSRQGIEGALGRCALDRS